MLPTSLPWYESEDDFQAVLAVLPVEEAKDPLSFDEMVIRLKEIEKKAVQNGQAVHRIIIKPAAIKKWCEDNHRRVCRAAINDYAGLKLGMLLVLKGKN